MDLGVWPSEEALEERLAAELPVGRACVIGAQDVTWEALIGKLGGRGRTLDPITGRLALRVAAQDSARAIGGRYARVANTRGFLSAAARFVAEAERAGLAPSALAALADGDERTRLLADIYARWTRICDGCGSSSDRRRGALLAAQTPLGPLHLDVHPRLAWEPADVEALLVALARRVQGGRIRVRIPWGAGRPAIFGGLEPVLGAFEACAELNALDVVVEDPADAPGVKQSVVAALYRPGVQAPPPAHGTQPLSILVAPTPQAELRAVAAHVRSLVDQGSPPEDIAVAMRAPGAASRRLAEELARVGLLVDDRRGPPLASAPPARLALALVRLAERGFAREDVLEIVASHYVAAGDGVAPHRIAQLVRGLGLRELAPGGPGLERLRTLADLDGARAAAQLGRLLEPVAEQPRRASLAAHAAWLVGALDSLGILRTPDPSEDPRVAQALARDQSAIAALERLLGRLPLAAREAGHLRAIERADFAALLGDLMAEIPLRGHGVRGGAVHIVHLGDLAARSFEHIVIPGLIDGAAPARAVDDGIYGEHERRVINRALGRRVLPSFVVARHGQPDEQAPLPAERTPFENLMLVNAIAAARRTVLLSHATTSGDRACTRSPFLDEVLRAAPWAPINRLPLTPIASLDNARASADALARLALDSWSDPAGRLPGTVPETSALVSLPVQDTPAPLAARLARVAEVAAIERARWRYFAGAEPAGPFVGDVGPQAGLAARSGGHARAPIPAQQLEKYANCPFTFFAGRVLGAEPADESEDAPSPRNVGLLAHRCLETFYRGRARAGALPLSPENAAADRQALDDATAETFAEIEAEGHKGHAALWELGKRKLADDLWRYVASEEKDGTPWGGIPAFFELAFGLPGRGARTALPALVFDEGSEHELHVGGRIDRIDVLEGGKGFVVVDYKLGGKEGERAKLREDVCGVTQLQLPLYARAARAGLAAAGHIVAGASADAAFVSLRDAVATKTLAEVHGDDTETLLGAKLDDRVRALGTGIRAGNFEVRPIDCARCTYRTVCRVAKLAGRDVDLEEDAA